MVSIRLFAVAGLAVLAAPIAAQEAPLIDFNDALNHARVSGRLVRQAQARERSGTHAQPITRGQAEACARKKTFQRQFGANNVKVRKLYGLCRRIGR